MTQNILAYSSDDGSLCLRPLDESGDPAGPARLLAESSRTQLTYSWPCWSPDARSILVSATSRDREGEDRIEVWRFPADGSDAGRAVFVNPAESRRPIARDVPHYVAWAPDGRYAAVLARGRETLRLSLVDADGERPARPLLEGAPLYFSWAPDSTALAVHCGRELSLLELGPDGATETRRLLYDVPTFRAPVWSADGRSILSTAPSVGGGMILWRSGREGAAREAVAHLDGPCALLPAPGKDLLALASLAPQGTPAPGLRLLNLQSGRSEQVERGTVAGAFWAPDATAFYSLSQLGSEPELLLAHFDLGEGRSRRLARLRPSPAYATQLAFFDQYAQSHAALSADGRWLAVAGLIADNGAAAPHGNGPHYGCYLVPTDGGTAPRRLAAATLGFFAPSGAPA